MDLVIISKSDNSVGIFSEEFRIPCPFNKEDVEKEDLDFFRKSIANTYNDFIEIGIHYILYDFEIEAMNEEDC